MIKPVDLAFLKKVGGNGGGLPTGGAPYQQLVTDGDGNAKWEDRLAYEGSRLVIDPGVGAQLVKVSDEVPSWASVDVPVKYWLSNGMKGTIPTVHYTDLGNGSFFAEEYVVFIMTDNIEFRGVVFPEKGVYFLSVPDVFYTTGITSEDSDTPEITWDGSLEAIKKIDEKFIPSTNPNIPKNYRVVFEETSSDVFQCNCTYSELKDFAVAGYPIYGVLLNRTVPADTYQYNLIMVEYDGNARRMEFEFATGNGLATRLYYYEDGYISNEAPIE